METIKLRHINGDEDSGRILAPVSLWDFIAPTTQGGSAAPDPQDDGEFPDLLSSIPLSQ